jgi:hypothetical protein
MSGRWLSNLSIACAAALALATQNAGACDVQIVAAPAAVRIDYDAFAASTAETAASFDIDNRGDAACVVDLAIVRADHVPIDEITIASSDVRLKVSTDPVGGKVTPRATGIWAVRVEPSVTTRVTMRFDVIAGGVVAAGVHSDELSLELRQTGSAATLSAATPLLLALVSPPRAQMNIAGATGSYGSTGTVSAIDFGTLESGAARRVFLQIRANTTAILSIDSQHFGRLMPTADPESPDSITYAVQLSNEPVDLTQHWQREIAPPHTIAGTSLPLDITVGAVGAKPAGAYADLITIMLSAI